MFFLPFFSLFPRSLNYRPANFPHPRRSSISKTRHRWRRISYRRKSLTPVSSRGLGSITILVVLRVVGVTYYAVVLFNYGRALVDDDLDSLIALLVPSSFTL
ncbi:hypothetical protein OROMI_006709 [Orobanche minor]